MGLYFDREGRDAFCVDDDRSGSPVCRGFAQER